MSKQNGVEWGHRKRGEWKSVWSDQTWCLPTFYYYFINREISPLSTYTVSTMDGKTHTQTHVSFRTFHERWILIVLTQPAYWDSWAEFSRAQSTHAHTRTYNRNCTEKLGSNTHNTYIAHTYTRSHAQVYTHEHTYKEVEKGKACPCSSSSKSNSIRSQHQKQ